MVLVAGIFATIVCTAVSGMVPVWMQVDPAVRELTGTYFFILYLPMLFRSASILFGTVLRAAGDTKTPMRVGIIVNCINIVLNFLLIYDTRTVSLLGLRLVIPGAGWGVIGAAAASALSYVWGGIHITWVLWRHPLVSPKGMSLKPDMPDFRHILEFSIFTASSVSVFYEVSCDDRRRLFASQLLHHPSGRPAQAVGLLFNN